MESLEETRAIEIYQQGKVIWQSETVTLRDLGQGCSATSLHSRGCLAARALKGTHELDFPPKTHHEEILLLLMNWGK
jgi:hypothetical protein